MLTRRETMVAAAASSIGLSFPSGAEATPLGTTLPVFAAEEDLQRLKELLKAAPIPSISLVTKEVTTKYLSPAALAQSRTLIKSTHRKIIRKTFEYHDVEKGVTFSDYTNVVIPCQYLSIPVEIDETGEVNDDQVRRWSLMLNDLVDRNIWNLGCLAPTTVIRLQPYGLERPAAMFTFLFADLGGMPTSLDYDRPDPLYAPEKFNELVGFPVITGPVGTIQNREMSVWDRFPWR